MQRLRFVSVLLLVFLVTSCKRSELEQVSGTNFCVPPEARVSTNTRQIPSDIHDGEGFAFKISSDFYISNPNFKPSLSINGKPIRIYGSIGPANIYKNWASPLPSSYYFKQSQIKSEIDFKYFGIGRVIVYISPARDSWVVWSIKKTIENRDVDIPIYGEVLAVCKISASYGDHNERASNASCNRVIIDGGLYISYNFNYSNIDLIEDFDNKIKTVVYGWKCE